LVNQTPYSLAEHLDELKDSGAQNLRIDLSYTHPSQATEIIRALQTNQPVPGHTANFTTNLR
jgi:hypothetical protein